MDLLNAVLAFRQADTMSRVQYAVARKILDQQQLQGSAAVKLIESAGQMAASAGDQLVAAATGLGGTIDTYG